MDRPAFNRYGRDAEHCHDDTKSEGAKTSHDANVEYARQPRISRRLSDGSLIKLPRVDKPKITLPTARSLKSDLKTILTVEVSMRSYKASIYHRVNGNGQIRVIDSDRL